MERFFAEKLREFGLSPEPGSCETHSYNCKRGAESATKKDCKPLAAEQTKDSRAIALQAIALGIYPLGGME